jgi:non-ribosomal peptide synthetase component F
MKGTRKEWSRDALHAHLRATTGIPQIHSEYGMTELLSQAYALENGRFQAPPWLRVVIGDPGDPGAWLSTGQRGRIHLVDLANLHSCAFLATGDVGRSFPDGSFEVLGRFDAAEVRGCNLMVHA